MWIYTDFRTVHHLATVLQFVAIDNHKLPFILASCKLEAAFCLFVCFVFVSISQRALTRRSSDVVELQQQIEALRLFL